MTQDGTLAAGGAGWGKPWQPWAVGAGLALVGGVLFSWGGNATRGYIDTPSVFVWWFSQWFNEGSDSEHGPLVLLLAAYLGWDGWKRRADVDASPRFGTALGWLAGAVGLNLFGFFVQETRINILAVLAWVYGMAWALGGARAGRASLFPLFVMLFAIPMSFVQDVIGSQLRYAVIMTVHALTTLAGLEIQRIGTVLTSPGRDYVYDVAPACSGIRSLLVVAVLTLAVGYFTAQRWWRRGLLLALALPFAFLGNLLRILLIVLAGHFLGAEWGLRVHDYSGWVVFVIVLGLTLIVATLLEKRLPEPPLPEPPLPPAPALRQRRVGVLAGLLVLSLGAGVAGVAYLRDGATGRQLCGLALTPEGELVPLPTMLDHGWLGTRLEMSEAERTVLPPDTGFARVAYRHFDDRRVLYTVVLSGLDRSSIHRPEICLRAQGWNILHAQAQPRPGSPQGADWTLMLAEQASADGSQRAYALLAYWFVSGRDEAGTHLQRRLLDLQYRLRGEAHQWAYLLVQTPLTAAEVATLQPGDFPKSAVDRLAEVCDGVVHAR